jgi:inner membrane protein
MTGSTHIVAGLNALWLLEVLPGAANENIALLAGAAAFGALLPDLDASQSQIKHLSIGGVKPFYLPATAIYRQLGHRSLLHSLWGLAYIALVGALLSPFIGWKTILALWLGYASHLVVDALTKSGIPLLYPNARRFHLFPKGWRVTTSSLAEEMIFVLLSLSFFALLLRHLGL